MLFSLLVIISCSPSISQTPIPSTQTFMQTELPFTSEISPTVPPSKLINITPTPEAVLCYEWGGYYLANQVCTSDECLFITDHPSCKDYPIGITKVEGYYLQIERTMWGETRVCNSFQITNGSDILIDSILSRIERGVPFLLNEFGQPIIILDISVLDEAEISRLQSSTSKNTVSLLLLLPPPLHQGTNVCTSIFEIIEVE